ncbi:MAG: DEAD/DEAH box helicase [Arachnia sp.]
MDWSWLLQRDEAVAVHERPAAEGEVGKWPQWFPEPLREQVTAAGIPAPWRHQVELAEHAHAGRHVAICTPTGSGKSLAYLLPILAATADPTQLVTAPGRLRSTRPTAMYLAPTKALAHDQLRAAAAVGQPGWRLSALDGDADQAERRFAREHASFVLTNPDMVHYSILPRHRDWSGLLAGLRYLVIDEAHRYQGIFGAHVATVVRRLRRVCALYGAEPTVVLASATLPNAAEFGGALIGEPRVEVVAESTAPHGPRTTVLWRPEASLRHDTASLLAMLSNHDAQTLAFVASRAGAELVSLAAQELSNEPARIASYRGGYLALERRALERALHERELLAVATTNALELGVDVSGVDAVLVSGYPGRLSSFWQQAGRAGRGQRPALAVLLARENPLDAYLLDHPELVFGAPVEAGVVHPGNPHVLGPHLAAAAQEHPLTAADQRWFGGQLPGLLHALAQQGVLRDRGERWYWTRPERAVDFVNLRSASGAAVEIVEAATGRIVGVVDRAAADRTAHIGAVYLHQGDAWVITDADVDAGEAFAVAAQPGYYTQPQSSFEIEVIASHRSQRLGRTEVAFGDVRLTSQITGYLRRDEVSHEVLDATALDLPTSRWVTQAVWWTVPESLMRELGWAPLRLGAALHAAEHTAIGLLPAFAPCDRWDIGGVSTPLHADTGLPTVFVHDGAGGGSGFAAHASQIAEAWLCATLERLESCRCESGCPACIHSPKCGNANQVLNKADAARVLGLILSG